MGARTAGWKGYWRGQRSNKGLPQLFPQRREKGRTAQDPPPHTLPTQVGVWNMWESVYVVNPPP